MVTSSSSHLPRNNKLAHTSLLIQLSLRLVTDLKKPGWNERGIHTLAHPPRPTPPTPEHPGSHTKRRHGD